jgi:arylsulfatase A-like enzyme/tetratricopeptide (TPR) repeat protein
MLNAFLTGRGVGAVRRAWLRPVAVGLVLALSGVACSGGATGPLGEDESDPARSESQAADSEALHAGPNLVLVTLDTLRADHLGTYGYEPIETPEIDRFAREGVRFEEVASPVPITLPAHASILTGQIPPHHGVRNNGTFRLDASAVTLAEVLSAEGYATGGFIGSFVLDSRFGTAQGFDFYTDFRAAEAETASTPFLEIERRGEEVVEEATEWMRIQSRPFFAWIHLYDPHSPYEPPEPFASRYPGRPYDGEIAYTDHVLGTLRRQIEEMGNLDDTLVVILADHGEGLGEHGETWHTYFVYDSTVRVPLILWAPGSLPAGVVVQGQTSGIDVLPTSLSLLGIDDPAAEARDGIDLRPMIIDPAAAGHPAYTESLVPFLNFGWSELRGLRAGEWKYISAPRPELYHLRDDPGETENLLGAEPRRAADMRATLDAMVVDDDVDAVVSGQQATDPETMERLRSLGYVGGGGTVPDLREIDPKDKIAVYEAFNDAIDAVVELEMQGRWAAAERELIGADNVAPNHFFVRYHLGKVALAQGQIDRAIEILEGALELNPSYSLSFIELAKAYEAAGEVERAADLLREAMRAYPDVFTFPLQLGGLLERQHRNREALEAYRVARRMLPGNTRVLSRMAFLSLAEGEPEVALELLETAADLGPGDPLVWGNLGTVLGGLGRLAEAEAAFRRGLELAPDQARLHFNLGLVLMRQNRLDEAAAALRETLEIDPAFEDARALLARISGG